MGIKKVDVKYQEVSILEIFSKGNPIQWNTWLTRCLASQDISALKKTYNGLQINMASLAKKNLSNEQIDILFIRLQRSIEITLKRILKHKHPSPLDNPLNKNDPKFAAEDMKKHLLAKRKRDHEFELFLRKESY